MAKNKEKQTTQVVPAADNQETNKEGVTSSTPEPTVLDAVTGIGRELLAGNPEMATVYMAADGMGFYALNDAENYARNLNNKVITTVNRL